MGHLTSRNAYKNLEDRINWFTQGAPAFSGTFYKILQVLYRKRKRNGSPCFRCALYGEEGREDLEYQRGEGGEVSDSSLREGPSGGLLPQRGAQIRHAAPMAGFIELP